MWLSAERSLTNFREVSSSLVRVRAPQLLGSLVDPVIVTVIAPVTHASDSACTVAEAAQRSLRFSHREDCSSLGTS